MKQHVNMDQHLLRLFFVISLVIATLAMFRMGPVYPVFSIMKFGVGTLAIAFVAYLTAFLGAMAYMTSRTRMIDEVLDSSGYLGKFTDSLTEPMGWANWSLGMTLAYYVSTNVSNPLVPAIVFCFAAATVATTALSIFRNFHLLRMYLTTTLRTMVSQLLVREALMGQIKERIDQVAPEGCGNPDCPDCNPVVDPADTDHTVN